jgi:hypothetical protein
MLLGLGLGCGQEERLDPVGTWQAHAVAASKDASPGVAEMAKGTRLYIQRDGTYAMGMDGRIGPPPSSAVVGKWSQKGDRVTLFYGEDNPPRESLWFLRVPPGWRSKTNKTVGTSGSSELPSIKALKQLRGLSGASVPYFHIPFRS